MRNFSEFDDILPQDHLLVPTKNILGYLCFNDVEEDARPGRCPTFRPPPHKSSSGRIIGFV